MSSILLLEKQTVGGMTFVKPEWSSILVPEHKIILPDSKIILPNEYNLMISENKKGVFCYE